MDIDTATFGSAGFAERIQMANRAFGVRLWSAQLATVWSGVIDRLVATSAGSPHLVRRLRREIIALAPDSAAAEEAYRALMGDDERPMAPHATKIVYMILSCRKYEAKAVALHRRIARDLDPAFILIGDDKLEEARFDGQFTIVPAADNYESLTWKVMEGLVAVRQRFGAVGVLKIDDDSEIRMRPRLDAVAELVGSTQYAGRVVGDPDFDRCWHVGKCQGHPDEPYRRRYHGGFCGGPLYYLGPVALDRLVREYLFYRDVFSGEIFEDKAIGDVLRRHGITPLDQDLSPIFGIYNEISAPPPLPPLAVEVGRFSQDDIRGVDVSEPESHLSPAGRGRAHSEPAAPHYWTSRHDYWESHFAASEDPWQYDSAYEVTKYEQMLALLPPGPIEAALEVAYAEGHFTARLAPCVRSLIATDISATAVARAGARCGGLAHVQTRVLDFASDELPAGLDLIVCSEVL